jgi:hypothetical protein
MAASTTIRLRTDILEKKSALTMNRPVASAAAQAVRQSTPANRKMVKIWQETLLYPLGGQAFGT